MLEDKANELIGEEDAALLTELADSDAEPEDEPAEIEAAPADEDILSEDSEAADTADENLRRIAELEELLRAAEAERESRERELTCLTLLREAGLPAELAPAVMAAEDMAGAVDAVKSAVKDAVSAELSARCRSAAPLTGSRAPLTKEELMRLPVAELQRLRDSGTLLG